MDKIRAALASPGEAKSAPPAPAKPVVSKSGKFSVNDDDVNVRDQPDETSGRVVAKLAAGTIVEVVEATDRAYSVAGQTGLWYHIAEPSGWVFGVFLDPADD
jgi:hypothetical protein